MTQSLSTQSSPIYTELSSDTKDLLQSSSQEVPSAPQLSSETERLDPLPEIIDLSSGTKVRVLPLKMRQLFRLMRIVTRGGAAYLPLLRDALTLSGEADAAEAFGTQLLAIALIALPEAEDEAVDFIKSVVEPHDLGTRRDKQTREHNDSLRAALDEELYNPDPGDVVTILENVIAREKGDLVALGKRLGAMFTMAAPESLDAKIPTESSELTLPSSDRSPAPSTLSHQSTDGSTQSYSTSLFDG